MVNNKKITKFANIFGSNTLRFKSPDNWVPGPGQYSTQHKFNNRNGNANNASFKSTTARELKFVMDKDIPGTGQYNTEIYNALAAPHITGGAPNNFLILARVNEKSKLYPTSSPRVFALPIDSKIKLLRYKH